MNIYGMLTFIFIIIIFSSVSRPARSRGGCIIHVGIIYRIYMQRSGSRKGPYWIRLLSGMLWFHVFNPSEVAQQGYWTYSC